MRILIACLFLTLSHLSCMSQTDYHEKLKSIYKGTVPLMQPEALQEAMDRDKELIILDTRSPDEYAISLIPKATFIDYDNFSGKEVEHLDKNSKVIVYCSVGYRSERIGEKMQEMGFKDVHNLYGGIFLWKNQGREVVTPKGTLTDSVHTYNKNWSKWLRNGTKVYE